MLKDFYYLLSEIEKLEISEYKEIYYLGEKYKAENTDFKGKTIQDNDQNDYIINFNDHLSYRYEILSILGKGSFGQTVKCFDHKLKELVAIKIIKNKEQFNRQ